MYPNSHHAFHDEPTMTDLRGILPGQRPPIDATVLDEPTSEVPIIRPAREYAPEPAPEAAAAEPESYEPERSEPEVSPAEVAEPELSVAEVAEPEVVEPELAAAELAEPGLSVAEVAEPGLSVAQVAEPAGGDPAVDADLVTAEPADTPPAATESDVDAPAGADATERAWMELSTAATDPPASYAPPAPTVSPVAIPPVLPAFGADLRPVEPVGASDDLAQVSWAPAAPVPPPGLVPAESVGFYDPAPLPPVVEPEPAAPLAFPMVEDVASADDAAAYAPAVDTVMHDADGYAPAVDTVTHDADGYAPVGDPAGPATVDDLGYEPVGPATVDDLGYEPVGPATVDDLGYEPVGEVMPPAPVDDAATFAPLDDVVTLEPVAADSFAGFEASAAETVVEPVIGETAHAAPEEIWPSTLDPVSESEPAVAEPDTVTGSDAVTWSEAVIEPVTVVEPTAVVDPDIAEVAEPAWLTESAPPPVPGSVDELPAADVTAEPAAVGAEADVAPDPELAPAATQTGEAAAAGAWTAELEVAEPAVTEPAVTGLEVAEPVAVAAVTEPTMTAPVAVAAPEVEPAAVAAPEVEPVAVAAPEVEPVAVAAPEVEPVAVAEPEVEPVVVAAPERAPGDVVEESLAVWSEEAAAPLRERWRDLQIQFVDDPSAAVNGAKGLVSETVHELANTLIAAQNALDPFRDGDKVDTEAMRLAMRGYREFLDRLLAL